MFRWMAVAFLSVSTVAQAQDPRLYTIGSGDVNGSYYAAATALCQETNRAEAALRCSPEATPGSIYNMEALRTRQLDFAIVQSDVQTMALTGEGPFVGKPAFSDLRSVMSLYPETLTVLARPQRPYPQPGGACRQAGRYRSACIGQAGDGHAPADGPGSGSDGFQGAA